MDVLELSKLLIKQDSISPNDKGCQNIIVNLLKPYGFQFRWFNKNNVTNLLAYHNNKNQFVSPIFCFAGHTDVVPIGNADSWKYNPFLGEVINEDDIDYIYGRGSTDMKTGLAATITASINYIKSNPDHLGTIALMITSDEESIAIDGIRHVINVLKDEGKKIDYCIVAEPSSSNNVGDTIRLGRRGSVTFNCSIKGIQGHVAFDKLVDNPIHKASNFLYKLSTLKLDQGTEFFPPSSIQIVEIHSGVGADNVVPEIIKFDFNVRHNNLHSAESLKQTFINLAKNINLELNINYQRCNNVYLSKNGLLAQLAKESIKKHLDIDTVFDNGGGTSDGRFISEICDQVIELGGLNKWSHKINEKFKVKDIYSIEHIYEDIIKKILK